MRTHISATAARACAGLLFAPATFGGEQRKNDATISKYCSDHRDFGLSHGAGVTQFTTGSTEAHNADVCKLARVRAWLRVDNEGAWVTALNAMTR